LKNILILIFFLGIFNVYGQLKIDTIEFESANPYSFNDIITDLENQEKQTVFGKLTIPFDSISQNKKFPLVIGVAGSFGWSDHHYDYLKMYQEMGIATFELNSFKSRNITSTVGSQIEITMAAMILDAYRRDLGELISANSLGEWISADSLGGFPRVITCNSPIAVRSSSRSMRSARAGRWLGTATCR